MFQPCLFLAGILRCTICLWHAEFVGAVKAVGRDTDMCSARAFTLLIFSPGLQQFEGQMKQAFSICQKREMASPLKKKLPRVKQNVILRTPQQISHMINLDAIPKWQAGTGRRRAN